MRRQAAARELVARERVTFPQRGVPSYADGVMGDVEDSISDDEGFKEFIAQGIRYEQEAELGYHSS